ncbi:hypothetical protein TNCV_1262171 [Trichonephila clavipes]|nr:hypothetical protein TNCV_1262171 [Trichonephila clavipes]
MCKEVKILSKKILSLVDTGSQVTLMKESVWNQLGSPSLINSGNILTGFGLSKTHVIGSFNSTVSIDNQDFPVKINVVPNHSMNFDIIIGCNLIKQANLTITPDSVMFSKLQIEVSDASPQPFVFAITDDIPKFDIGPEIPKQTRNDVEALLVCYRPNKIKTTDIELSITMTDDKPIYHSPRRLPFTERDIVDKQIDEWIQNGVIEPCSSAYASQVLVVRKKTAVHEKIEFLGHIIENNKLFPSPSKTKSVVNYPEPKTTKEVQRFLGLTGYFRKFIPAYSVIAKPLSDLLRKDTLFNFDVKQKASFDELKRLLCQKPVLGIYRQNCETEIHTDASIDALSAVLLQRFPDDNSLHPIYYMSRKTSETERKYTSYELEVLAIIEALKKFKVYILGMPFKIITDCNAFTKTMSKKDLNTRIARWALNLQDYDYTILHRSGSQMAHVDALSRIQVLTNQCNDSIVHRIKESQELDPHILSIKALLQKGPYDNYCIKNNILYKFIDGAKVLVIPDEMQHHFIKNAHDKGHFSVKRTLEHIKNKYFIPQLQSKIEKYISNCVTCILKNKKSGKQEGFLHPLVKDDIPLNTYHIDHLGPLATSSKNYKFILAVIDSFTKFVWLYPTKTTSTSEFTCRNCGGGDRGRVAIYRPFGEVSLSLNRTITCMVLKANDRRTSCPCHDEFCGPRSDYVRQWSSGSVSRFYTTGAGSIPGIGKAHSVFHPYCSGSINEYQDCLETWTLGVSLQTDYLIGTSAHPPQLQIVTCTGMCTVGPGPYGLLRH